MFIRWLKFSNVILLFLTAGCVGAETRAVHNTMVCKERLEVLFRELETYGKSNPDFPRSDDGQLDLIAILSDWIRIENHCCPGNRSKNCYVFLKGLRPDDLDLSMKNPLEVIAMDSATNHPEGNGMEKVQLLMNHGFVVTQLINIETANYWRSMLRRGEVLDDLRNGQRPRSDDVP